MIAQTSILAYSQEKIKLNYNAQMYWNTLIKYGGEQPDYEMSYILGWEKGRVSARRNDCIKSGVVIDAGYKLHNPLTNKTVNVWRAVLPDEATQIFNEKGEK